jgi:hypothetical protein
LELIEICHRYLHDNLLPKDAFTVLDYCVGKNEHKLNARSIQLITRFSKEVFGSKSFLESRRESVEEVFGLEELSVNEVFLFKAVAI